MRKLLTVAVAFSLVGCSPTPEPELDVHVRAGLCATLIAKRPDGGGKDSDLVLRHAPNVLLALEHGGRWIEAMDANKDRPQEQRRLIEEARRACSTFGVATTADDR